MESAGVTLVKGDLRGIVRARRLSRAVMRNIRRNPFFSFLSNALGVPIAAAMLYPVFGLLLSPIIVAAASPGSKPSLRLLQSKRPQLGHGATNRRGFDASRATIPGAARDRSGG